MIVKVPHLPRQARVEWAVELANGPIQVLNDPSVGLHGLNLTISNDLDSNRTSFSNTIITTTRCKDQGLTVILIKSLGLGLEQLVATIKSQVPAHRTSYLRIFYNSIDASILQSRLAAYCTILVPCLNPCEDVSLVAVLHDET